MVAGRKEGICNAGRYTMDTMRVEFGLATMGNELGSHTSPWEAGLGRFIDMNKVSTGRSIVVGSQCSMEPVLPFSLSLSLSRLSLYQGDFIGREALLSKRQSGPQRLLAHFSVTTPKQETLLWGGESIYCGGDLVGSVTSGAFSHSAGQPVGLGFVGKGGGGGGNPLTIDEVNSWGPVKIEINGARYPATITNFPGLQ